MALLPFVSTVDAATESYIASVLDRIAAEADVRVIFAVESGSRAWGFPSTDSDYDVRFVYAHRPEWYLALRPGRDVIERPVDAALDVAGWDIRKALNQLLKPNPVLLEWLSSPIVYQWDGPATERLLELARRMPFHGPCLHHYRRQGIKKWAAAIEGRDPVAYKPYCYVLRPALALRWCREHPDAPPPMNVQALVAGLDLDAATLAEIRQLLDVKRGRSEGDTGPRLPRLDAMVADVFAWAEGTSKAEPRDDLYLVAEGLFRDLVMGRI